MSPSRRRRQPLRLVPSTRLYDTPEQLATGERFKEAVPHAHLHIPARSTFLAKPRRNSSHVSFFQDDVVNSNHHLGI